VQTVPGKPSARRCAGRTEKGVPGDGDALLLFRFQTVKVFRVTSLRVSSFEGCPFKLPKIGLFLETSRIHSFYLNLETLSFETLKLFHCVITPQAMRSPALPAGSVFMSSALA
jgi:hypothetical protein